jgi:trigger factor
MKVTTERLDNCQVDVIVELDAAEIDKKLRQTARRISRQVTVPGYRRGKAPFHAVVRVFGQEAIQHEALEDFGQELYEQALEQIDYEPYEFGELEDVEWDPFRMKILLPIRPEVDLGDYRSVRVSIEPEPVTDEEVEARLADLQKQRTELVPVERAAAWGDQVVVDKAGDKPIMSKENHEMWLEAGSKIPMPGFHEEIIGMSPGEDKTFTLTVPEGDYEADVVGQEAQIAVHLHTVREEDVPPLDDDLALMVGDYDSLDALRAALRKEMEAAAAEKAESEYFDKVLDAMIEGAVKIEYPPQAIDREAEYALKQMENNLASSGIELERFLAMIGKTRESYKQELQPAAEERLRKRLVLGELAKHEGLKVEEGEVEAEVERLSGMMGDRADEMRQMLQSPGGQLSVMDDLLAARAQERVIQIGKGEAPPLEAEVGAEAEAETGAEVEESRTEVEAAAGAESKAETGVRAGSKAETGDETVTEVEESGAEVEAGAVKEAPGEPA